MSIIDFGVECVDFVSMTEAIRREPVTHRSAWVRRDLELDRSWIVTLDDGDRREILSALDSAQPGAPLNLPMLGLRLDAIVDEIEGGRGVALIRGAPLEGASEQIERMFVGLAEHLGFPEAQDATGKRLHHVRAERAFKDRGEAQQIFQTTNIRAYQTNVELGFHGDGSDALFFLCVRQGKSGGETRLSSVTTAFNDLLARDVSIVETLQQPFTFDTRGETGAKPHQELPVFAYHAGELSSLYKRGYIELAQRIDGVAALTAAQVAALDALDETLASEKNCFSFTMQPGDILIANNYNVLHARTAFEDWPPPAEGRLMLRIWATLKRNRRILPPSYRTSREFAETYRRRVSLGDAE